MRGINRRVRGIKEEAKGVANRAAYHVASAMEATFPVRRRVGQRPPDHGKVASFSRVPGPSPGNSGHDPGQDRPNSAEILGIGAIAPLQYVEGLSDRQAADAVRGRIDWKYALGLELDFVRYAAEERPWTRASRSGSGNWSTSTSPPDGPIIRLRQIC